MCIKALGVSLREIGRRLGRWAGALSREHSAVLDLPDAEALEAVWIELDAQAGQVRHADDAALDRIALSDDGGLVVEVVFVPSGPVEVGHK